MQAPSMAAPARDKIAAFMSAPPPMSEERGHYFIQRLLKTARHEGFDTDSYVPSLKATTRDYLERKALPSAMRKQVENLIFKAFQSPACRKKGRIDARMKEQMIALLVRADEIEFGGNAMIKTKKAGRARFLETCINMAKRPPSPSEESALEKNFRACAERLSGNCWMDEVAANNGKGLEAAEKIHAQMRAFAIQLGMPKMVFRSRLREAHEQGFNAAMRALMNGHSKTDKVFLRRCLYTHGCFLPESKPA